MQAYAGFWSLLISAVAAMIGRAIGGAIAQRSRSRVGADQAGDTIEFSALK